jgi:hypothetical protein
VDDTPSDALEGVPLVVRYTDAAGNVLPGAPVQAGS